MFEMINVPSNKCFLALSGLENVKYQRMFCSSLNHETKDDYKTKYLQT